LHQGALEVSFHNEVEGLSLGAGAGGGAPPLALGEAEELPHLFQVEARLRGGATRAVGDGAAAAALEFSGGWEERLARQQRLELRAVEDAAARYRKEWESAKGRGALGEVGPGRSLMSTWFGPLRDAVETELDAIATGERGQQDRRQYGPYLCLLDADRLAAVTLSAVLHAVLSDTYSAPGAGPGAQKLGPLALQIGRKIQSEANFEQLKRKLRALSKGAEGAEERGRLAAMAKMLRAQQKAPSKRSDAMVKRLQVLLGEASASWSSVVHAKVGMALVDILMNTLTVDAEGRPCDRLAAASGSEATAFRRVYKHTVTRSGVSAPSFIQVTDQTLEHILESNSMKEVLFPRYLPMLVPPVPWTRRYNGGHVFLRTMVMRSKGQGAREQSELLKLADDGMHHGGGLENVYDALNVVGATAWRINRTVHDTARDILGGGADARGDKELAGLPVQWKHALPEPVEAHFRLARGKGQLLVGNLPETPRETEARRLKTYKTARLNTQLHSIKADLGYKMHVADEFRDESHFYFPHNVDFRGRAYPMHPYLHHLGSDFCRGVLQFAELKPLGEHGMDWLLIHLANQFGLNKLSLDERKGFATANLDRVFDCADRPLEGERWWNTAENPLQCLAACHEIAAALRNPAGAQSHLSGLPVHQDGSCNGLQHYAALGRDVAGGTAVNLMPCEKPMDVYSEVAELVAKQVEVDARGGGKDAIVAKLLSGNVDRKLVKQTVMTSVYGVTFVGAREQITNRLSERGWDDPDVIWRVSNYAARTTLNKIQEMFTGAKAHMSWLAQAAKLISAQGKPVEWTSPAGLPIVQPYRLFDRYRVMTSSQRIVLCQPNQNQPVNKKKQVNAFPPNYVHSVDSSHMMFTAVECKRRGIDSFAGVHDSFWTHAGSVDEMNRVIREEFVKLHSQPLLEMLKEELEHNHPETVFPDTPPKGGARRLSSAWAVQQAFYPSGVERRHWSQE
jgi:DNA-directed RNA polymerase